VAAVLLTALTPLIKKWMHEHETAEKKPAA
jgi:hypothetical protein